MNKEIARILKAKSPTGVTVQAADGRLFFLSDEVARRTAVPPNGLYEAYLALGERHRHRGLKPSTGTCAKMKRYLESHDAGSGSWRAVCLVYFEDCLDKTGVPNR